MLTAAATAGRTRKSQIKQHVLVRSFMCQPCNPLQKGYRRTWPVATLPLWHWETDAATPCQTLRSARASIGASNSGISKIAAPKLLKLTQPEQHPIFPHHIPMITCSTMPEIIQETEETDRWLWKTGTRGRWNAMAWDVAKVAKSGHFTWLRLGDDPFFSIFFQLGWYDEARKIRTRNSLHRDVDIYIYTWIHVLSFGATIIKIHGKRMKKDSPTMYFSLAALWSAILDPEDGNPW